MDRDIGLNLLVDVVVVDLVLDLVDRTLVHPGVRHHFDLVLQELQFAAGIAETLLVRDAAPDGLDTQLEATIHRRSAEMQHGLAFSADVRHLADT